MGGADLAWSWRELQDTPVYVTRFCIDLLAIKRRVMREKSEQANRGGGR
jgi:hypothetical protein